MTRRSRPRGRSGRGNAKGIILLAFATVITLLVGGAYVLTMRNRVELDAANCPTSGPTSITVVLVDSSDPLSIAQKQDFRNQLDGLRQSIGKYGRLAIFRVGAADQQLLQPLFDRCNPGDGSDLSPINGNPSGARNRWEASFKAPLDAAFQSVAEEHGTDYSPIMESVQSVTLTELQRPENLHVPRRLVLVSDLLQNTQGLSFYQGLPDLDNVTRAPSFIAARTNLEGVDVDLWMLSRPTYQRLQGEPLIRLWQALFSLEGGRVTHAYNISG